MNTFVTTCMENCKELLDTYIQSYITYLQCSLQNQQSLIGHITFHKNSWFHINISGANLLFTVIYRHSLCTTFTILSFLRTKINAWNALAKMQKVKSGTFHIKSFLLFGYHLENKKTYKKVYLTKDTIYKFYLKSVQYCNTFKNKNRPWYKEYIKFGIKIQFGWQILMRTVNLPCQNRFNQNRIIICMQTNRYRYRRDIRHLCVVMKCAYESNNSVFS
jgi:hypothetical protein